MDLSGYSISEVIKLYSLTIKELKNRGVLRTKNVVGELGEYLVFEEYYKNPDLPNLNPVPVGTKNINAISLNGERYSIKSTTGSTTGVFYGLQPPESNQEDTQIFEYVILCILDEDCELEAIYQLSWEGFIKHKRWHSRMRAWNLAITKALKEEAIVIYQKDEIKDKTTTQTFGVSNDDIEKPDYGETEEYNQPNIKESPSVPVTWNKTGKVNHAEVRQAVANKLEKHYGVGFEKSSQSRYISADKEQALFVLSASYSQKNGEFWYSINDENLPWLELFPACHIAFALGSSEQFLVFDYSQLSEMLKGCLKTKADPTKGKMPHFHIAFSVESNGKVYFKKKKPEREFLDVTNALFQEASK